MSRVVYHYYVDRSPLYYTGIFHLYNDPQFSGWSRVYNDLADICPRNDNAHDLGYASLRWRNIYAASGAILTSDERLKELIKSLDTEMSIKFTKAINAISYKFIDGKRTHFGFSSQQIYEAMQAVGLTDMDFAGFIKSPVYADGQDDLPEDERDIINYSYGIRDNEIIPIHHTVLNDLLNRIEKLEAELLVKS